MSWDPIWEEIFKKQAWGKYPGEELIRFIARNFYNVTSRQDVKILEVGCGPGANLWYMAKEGFTVFGIDGSETAVKLAKERLDLDCENWEGKLVVGDITSLPFEDYYFDAVIDNEAVCCNSYQSSILIYDELSRVTKKHGKIYSRAFAKGCWGDDSGEKVGHNAYLPTNGPLAGIGYCRFTDLEEIPELFRSFTINAIELLTKTYNSRTDEIKEWIIIGEK